MHESLQLSDFQNLPLTMRRLAQATAAGSTEHMSRLVDSLTRPSNQLLLVYLLPLVYQLLDPARIPDSDADFATLAPDEAATYYLTMKSLEALASTQNIPQEAARDLWSRVWHWFEFLEAHHRVRHYDSMDRVTCSRVIQFAYNLQKYPEMRQVIVSTPGFYGVLSRAWIAVIAMKGDPVRGQSSQYILSLFTSVVTFLADDNLCNRANLETFVDGVGDHGPSVLAMWSLRHLHYTIGMFDDPQLRRNYLGFFLAFTTLLPFILDAAEGRPVREPTTDWLIQLVRQDLVGGLVRAIRAIHVLSAEDVDWEPLTLVNQCLNPLERLFNNRTLYHPIRSSIALGLIEVVALCAQRRTLDGLHSNLKVLLLELLPACTPYWGDGSGEDVVSVLTKYEEAIPHFVPEVREAWTRFATMAMETAAVFESFDAADEMRMRGCDNTLCGIFGPMKDFKRCKGCKSLYYCSTTCQAVDWQNGHRAACKTHEFLLRGRIFQVTLRHRAFMRALLHRDYIRTKLRIFTNAIKCMRQWGDPGKGYFVLFDYTCLGPQVEVVSLAAPTTDSERLKWIAETGLQWHEIVARAARSEGRMIIHVMRLRDADYERHWIVPLRCSTGAIHEQLVNIACDGDGEEGLQDLAELVAKSNLDVTEFH
ncbi:hypothetical protein FB45DRAFT_1065021 [Roridomyces roridus]|uniref:MYND-type domain-containing protein n=1 Tax=Roridomyces roridus TaxID=1738132 RepID=A0AAD7B7Y8_9AGAR|nr:hypothetical protein FB45DRAFT_1065021 [Roridomyces roridus]